MNQESQIQQTEFLSSYRTYQTIYPLAMGGQKVPYGVSNPVLRRDGDRVYLAFFVYTYTYAQMKQKAIGRPCSWILANIRNGKLIEIIHCAARSFTQADPKEQFSMEGTARKADTAFFTETYDILDKVRQTYLDQGGLDKQRYGAYLEQILQVVPPAYHRFYRELSNI